MENNLKNKVSQLVETSIDNIFSEVHFFAETSGGDILPEQMLQLKELEDGLSALVYKYLLQNMVTEND